MLKYYTFKMRTFARAGRMESMLQEGAGGEHVRGQADPGGTLPPVRAAVGAPALWARRWAPPSTDASIRGPRSRGPEKRRERVLALISAPLSFIPVATTSCHYQLLLLATTCSYYY